MPIAFSLLKIGFNSFFEINFFHKYCNGSKNISPPTGDTNKSPNLIKGEFGPVFPEKSNVEIIKLTTKIDNACRKSFIYILLK